jgi:hypothetical protein
LMWAVFPIKKENEKKKGDLVVFRQSSWQDNQNSR